MGAGRWKGPTGGWWTVRTPAGGRFQAREEHQGLERQGPLRMHRRPPPRTCSTVYGDEMLGTRPPQPPAGLLDQTLPCPQPSHNPSEPRGVSWRRRRRLPGVRRADAAWNKSGLSERRGKRTVLYTPPEGLPVRLSRTLPALGTGGVHPGLRRQKPRLYRLAEPPPQAGGTNIDTGHTVLPQGSAVEFKPMSPAPKPVVGWRGRNRLPIPSWRQTHPGGRGPQRLWLAVPGLKNRTGSGANSRRVNNRDPFSSSPSAQGNLGPGSSPPPPGLLVK